MQPFTYRQCLGHDRGLAPKGLETLAWSSVQSAAPEKIEERGQGTIILFVPLVAGEYIVKTA